MQTEQQKQHATAKDANFFNEVNKMITKKIGERKLTFGTVYETENTCMSFGHFPPAIIEDLALKYVATNPEFEQKLLTNYLKRQKTNLETNVVPLINVAIEIFKPLLANVSNDIFKNSDTVEEKEEKPLEENMMQEVFGDALNALNKSIMSMDAEEKEQLSIQIDAWIKSGEVPENISIDLLKELQKRL